MFYRTCYKKSGVLQCHLKPDISLCLMFIASWFGNIQWKWISYFLCKCDMVYDFKKRYVYVSFYIYRKLGTFRFSNNYHEKKKNILTTRFRQFAIYNIFYVTHIDDGYGIKRNPNMAMVKWWSANCQCLLFFFICFEGWKYFSAS